MKTGNMRLEGEQEKEQRFEKGQMAEKYRNGMEEDG
jgi:hypothetical protein